LDLVGGKKTAWLGSEAAGLGTPELLKSHCDSIKADMNSTIFPCISNFGLCHP